MSVALRLYEKLTEAGEDTQRAKLFAEAIEAVEERYPQLGEVATQSQLRETELRLQKEIKEVEAKLEKEIKEVEARLRLEIEMVRKEMKEIEARLIREIKGVEVSLHKAIAAQTRWFLGGLTVLAVVLKLADLLIG